MQYNIICIDPSLSCTAVVVNDMKAAFVKDDVAQTKTGKLKGWFDTVEPFADIVLHSATNKKLSFAETEIDKLERYDAITDNIITFILSKVTPGIPSKVFIEGYSFSSAAGPLIDLVTFGTLLRRKLYFSVSPDIMVVAPTELKAYAAKLTYPPIPKGKKVEYRNREGLAGGSFKKHDMYKALIENDELQCEWVQLLREHWSDVVAQKSVPKPIEDLNDAKLLYEVAKANKYM